MGHYSNILQQNCILAHFWNFGGPSWDTGKIWVRHIVQCSTIY